MSEISYFQKYSQKENHITNNTLLMFRHVYRHSPQKFEGFLNALLDEDEAISVGLSFQQQVGKVSSIPDAQMTQNAVQIFIEAKRGGDIDIQQIRNHIDGVKGENADVFLIALTKEGSKQRVADEFDLLKKPDNLILKHVIYDDLVENLAAIYGEHEEEMRLIVDDYISFLDREGLLQDKYKVAVIPCGNSHTENVKHAAYFEPSHRRSKGHVNYMGLYTNKYITHIGEISKTVIAKWVNGKLEVDDSTLLHDERERLERLIKDSRNGAYPTLGDEAMRFYLLNNLQNVNLKKVSKGGFMGLVYKDLLELVPRKAELPAEPSFEQIIEQLEDGIRFE